MCSGGDFITGLGGAAVASVLWADRDRLAD